MYIVIYARLFWIIPWVIIESNTQGDEVFYLYILIYLIFLKQIYIYTLLQKNAILVRMQFLNDIIKSRHGSKIS